MNPTEEKTAAPAIDGAIALDVWLVVDTSGSIRSTGMQKALEGGLDLYARELASSATALEVKVAVKMLTFAETSSWKSITQLPTSTLAPVQIDARGLTNASSMLDLLAKELRSMPRGLSFIAPLIILISDGMPTDDYTLSMAKFLAEVDGADAHRAALAFGPDASMAFCREFLAGSIFDPLRAASESDVSTAIVQLVHATAAILNTQAGHITPVKLPASYALPEACIAISDAAQQWDFEIASACLPLVGKQFSVAAALQIPKNLPEDFDLNRLIEEFVIRHAALNQSNPEAFIDNVRKDVIAESEKVLGTVVELLCLVIATPHHRLIAKPVDALFGSAPVLADSNRTRGQDFETKSLESKHSAFIVCSPAFCTSFGHADNGDLLASEISQVYRERGESFIRNSTLAWASRAAAANQTPWWALAVLFKP